MDLRRRLFLRGSLPTVQARACAPTPPRPPWAVAEERFVEQCTRCGACAKACPHSLIRGGDGGFPEIGFEQHGCDFCRACVEACDAGALDDRELPFVARVKVAEHCLARNRVECRACGDTCDAGALHFVPALGGASRLAIDVDRCTGCGACVAPCPVGAITLAVAAPRPVQGEECSAVRPVR